MWQWRFKHAEVTVETSWADLMHIPVWDALMIQRLEVPDGGQHIFPTPWEFPCWGGECVSFGRCSTVPKGHPHSQPKNIHSLTVVLSEHLFWVSLSSDWTFHLKSYSTKCCVYCMTVLPFDPFHLHGVIYLYKGGRNDKSVGHVVIVSSNELLRTNSWHLPLLKNNECWKYYLYACL